MTSRLTPAVLILAAAVAVAGGLLSTRATEADGPGGYDPDPESPVMTSDVSVVANANGVTIYISLEGLTPGDEDRPGTDDTISTTEGPECTADPVNIGNASIGWVRDGFEEHPDSTPWSVSCDNGYFAIAWIPSDAGAPPEVVIGEPPASGGDPVTLAASIVDTIPLPPIALDANPDVGLVAVPTWFWVQGYDGSPLTGSRTLAAITVAVEITPSAYRWSFGDGTTLQTDSLGEPYPRESDLRHTYEQSSLAAGGAFQVELKVEFDARYRVNDGEWVSLDPVARSFTRDYPVQQLQSVLTSSR